MQHNPDGGVSAIFGRTVRNGLLVHRTEAGNENGAVSMGEILWPVVLILWCSVKNTGFNINPWILRKMAE